MLLQRSKCVLCAHHILNIRYNLKSTLSEKSGTPLIKFVESICKNIFLMHCNICNDCYHILNEIDEIQCREKDLYNKLRGYISNIDYNVDKDKTSGIETDINEISANITETRVGEIDFKKFSGLTVKKVSRNEEEANISEISSSNNDMCKKQAFEQVQSIIKKELTEHESKHCNKLMLQNKVLCELCGEDFKTKIGLEKHMKKHKNDDGVSIFMLNGKNRKWTCNICEKDFTQKISLSRHLFLHSGEPRFQCDKCGKSFVHHSSFNVHKKIHDGERNFKCGSCKSCFLTGSHLKRHMRAVHTKEKSFSCLTCGKKFAEKYNLVTHTKTHKVWNIIF